MQTPGTRRIYKRLDTGSPGTLIDPGVYTDRKDIIRTSDYLRSSRT